MNWMNRSARLALLMAVMVLLLGGTRLNAIGANQSPAVTQPPADYAPTAADAARTATEQLKVLPATAVQVDCAPGVRTLPIFTTLSGIGGPQRLYILADGRCFQDPSNKAEVPVEQIEP
jgi:hypothetical protein